MFGAAMRVVAERDQTESSNLDRLIVGSRLKLTFTILMVLILGGNGLLLWQFHIARRQTDRLNAVNRQVIAVLRLEESLRSFDQRLGELARARDADRIRTEAGPLSKILLEQTQRARDAVTHLPAQIPIDPAFLPTLDAIEITLPSQLEAIASLTAAGDWETVHLRLANELQPMEIQTSVLIENIDREGSAELAKANTNMDGIQRRILVIVPATAVVTFCIAAFLAWVVTRRIIALRLEERIAERTRIARELHDNLLQGVISVSMHLHIATGLLPIDSPAKPLFDRLLQLTGQVIDEGRNTVRDFRSIDRKSEELEGALSRIPQNLDLKDRADFRVVVEGQPQPLHSVIHDEVYSIGREALVNAFRHSGAGKIQVELEYSARYLRVIVRDDGCGIALHVLQSGREGHWGLSGMRERAQRIGAKLKVFSRVGAGTEIELRVPGNIAFEHPSSPAARWIANLYRRLAAITLPERGR